MASRRTAAALTRMATQAMEALEGRTTEQPRQHRTSNTIPRPLRPWQEDTVAAMAMEVTRRRRLEGTERIHSNRATASRTRTVKRRRPILAHPAVPMALLPTTHLLTVDMEVMSSKAMVAMLIRLNNPMVVADTVITRQRHRTVPTVPLSSNIRHIPAANLTADIVVGMVERNMALLRPTQAGNSERRHEWMCSSSNAVIKRVTMAQQIAVQRKS